MIPRSPRLQRGRMRQTFPTMDSLGKSLVLFGLVIAAVGAALWLFGRAGGGFLPGDIVIEKKNVRFYFPIVTCLVISLVLSLIAWLTRR